MDTPMSEPSLFSEEEETVRLAEELLASEGLPHGSWSSHYRNLADRYKKLLAQSLRLMKIGDLMQKELNRLNEQVRRTEEKYRLIFENSPVGIFHFDSAGTIQDCNGQFVRITGGSREKVTAMNLLTDVKDQEVLAAVRNALAGGIGHYEGSYTSLTGNETFVVKCDFASMVGQDGSVIGGIGITEDITSRKMAEEQIKASLKEKEVLLREIHHRVKNNFQMIAGLLMLQADQTGVVDSRSALKQTEARVHAMARVHEKMYQSGDLGEIKMDEYLSELAEDLICFHESTGQRVVFRKHLEPVTASIDTAIPCGLIVTELVTNAMKHAFPKNVEGTVEIGLRKLVDDGYELMVRDNGVGLPEGFALEKNAHLGLKLVQAFTKRFHGKITIEREHGTGIRVRFKRD